MFPARAEESHGHAHGETVRDLFQNHRAPAIRNLAVDLDPAVDRAGVRDHRVGLGTREALFVEAKHRRVFADTREHRHALTLVLNPQQIYHIRVANRLVDVMGPPATEFLENTRYERRWSRQGDV